MTPRRRPAKLSLSRVLVVVSVCLFVIAAFTADGDALWGVPLWTWISGGFAAWALSDAVQ